MSAVEVLVQAGIAGVVVTSDHTDLILESCREPPPYLVEELARHKQSILGLLRPKNDRWAAEDWRALFDERAGIVEFDGGLSRSLAETQAFEFCIIDWLNRNPVQSVQGACVGCGTSDRTYDPLVPFGTESGGHAWLHSRCWRAWSNTRRANAIAALTAMGINVGP